MCFALPWLESLTERDFAPLLSVERARTVDAELVERLTEPNAFLNSTCEGNVLSLSCGESNTVLLLCRPADSQRWMHDLVCRQPSLHQKALREVVTICLHRSAGDTIECL